MSSSPSPHHRLECGMHNVRSVAAGGPRRPPAVSIRQSGSGLFSIAERISQWQYADTAPACVGPCREQPHAARQRAAKRAGCHFFCERGCMQDDYGPFSQRRSTFSRATGSGPDFCEFCVCTNKIVHSEVGPLAGCRRGPADEEGR